MTEIAETSSPVAWLVLILVVHELEVSMLNTPAVVAVVVQKVLCTKVPADDVEVAIACQLVVLLAQIAHR